MRIKRLILVASVIYFSICTTGCGETLMPLTEDEEAYITLYSAKMVAKYNENQTNGLCNARVRDGELPNTGSEEGEDQNADNTDETSLDLENADGSASDANPGTTDVDEGLSLTDAIGIDGLDFTCSSFDVSDECKASSSYVLTKVEGKSYLVLNIKGENTSDQDISFDKKQKYSLTVNGNSTSNTQNTFTSNDLSTFSGKISAGGSKDFILVFQFDNSAVSDVTSLDLQVTDDDVTRGTTI